METILLVDDNPTNLQVLFQTLQGEGHTLLIAENGEDALSVAVRARPSLILLDVMMPVIDGFETCRRLKANPETSEASVIFLSALNDTQSKVKGLEVGAVDFVSKPFQAEEVIARVRTHLRIHTLQRDLKNQKSELERELQVAQQLLQEARERVDGPLLGESIAVCGLRMAVEKYARTDQPLLLVGPPGAGREAIARAIHHQSERERMAFIHVRCAMHQTRTELQLFPAPGDEDKSRPVAKFDLAEKGTVFLEGVEDLPSEEQARLLQILKGASKDEASSVRIIASIRHNGDPSGVSGLNPELQQLLGQNQLSIPGLAERREDIPVLVEFFLKQHSRRMGRPIDSISEESLGRLKAYGWPGNIRELSNLLERAVVGAEGPMLEIDKSLMDGGLRLGSYQLVEKLSSGGMGEVWIARHQMLARPAAVKLIRSEMLVEAGDRDTLTKRFQREAEATARLTSPNTVQLFDFGISESGDFFLVMELLKGLDLDSMVLRFGPIAPERAVYFLRQACRSLGEAHAARLIHRDIKPANIFASRLGQEYDFLKVLDFGVVKPMAEDLDSQLTASGKITGTPAYMAPEMVLDGQVDSRSDLYALGCVAYWLLCGVLVFEGENPVQTLMHHVQTPPEPPSKVSELDFPAALDEVVMACLQKKPEDRPQSADELWRRLGEIHFDRPWTPERAEKWWRTHLPEMVERSS